MQITIETQKMLKVLLHHNMDEKDAKAILYDLITGSDIQEDEPEDEPEAISPSQDEQPKVEEQVIKPKRKVNFSSFGGNAEPLAR